MEALSKREVRTTRDGHLYTFSCCLRHLSAKVHTTKQSSSRKGKKPQIKGRGSPPCSEYVRMTITLPPDIATPAKGRHPHGINRKLLSSPQQRRGRRAPRGRWLGAKKEKKLRERKECEHTLFAFFSPAGLAGRAETSDASYPPSAPSSSRTALPDHAPEPGTSPYLCVSRHGIRAIHCSPRHELSDVQFAPRLSGVLAEPVGAAGQSHTRGRNPEVALAMVSEWMMKKKFWQKRLEGGSILPVCLCKRFRFGGV